MSGRPQYSHGCTSFLLCSLHRARTECWQDLQREALHFLLSNPAPRTELIE
uniref:Uncharacterized protein n=1 Tax=Arundo donax TaxID=35708 RepID=A0A0A9AER7_ARUDO